MSEKLAVELGHVQKTMLLPLWGRAFETQKDKPLLVDKAALEIVNKVDYDFASLAQSMSPLTQVAWIMRSLCTDEAIRGFLKKYPRATIVNLGCGLDTTFERVDNGSLRWYDLDLPDVINLRRQLIGESERRTFIAASFLETDWLEQISVPENVFFIAAGVFYYFEESQVKGFLLRLANRFPGSEILFDVASPYGVSVANKMVIKNSGLDEKSYLKWGLADPNNLLAWDARLWLVATYFYFGKRARSLSRRMQFFGFISDWLKIQYMVHLGIKPKSV
jgi:O-methyltransferase involved in polyketide biosynthesis